MPPQLGPVLEAVRRSDVACRHNQFFLAVGMDEYGRRAVGVARLADGIGRSHHFPVVRAGLLVDRQNVRLAPTLKTSKDDLILPKDRRTSHAEVLPKASVGFGDVSLPHFLAVVGKAGHIAAADENPDILGVGPGGWRREVVLRIEPEVAIPGSDFLLPKSLACLR